MTRHIRIRPSVAELHRDQDTRGHRFCFGFQGANDGQLRFRNATKSLREFVPDCVESLPIVFALVPHKRAYRGQLMYVLKGVQLLDPSYALIARAGLLSVGSHSKLNKLKRELRKAVKFPLPRTSEGGDHVR